MSSVKNLALDSRSLAVQAANDIKNKADYFGPPGPAPKLAAVRRPQMRNDYVPYAPLEPADLPTTPGTGDPSLLDPNNPVPAPPPALEPPGLEPLPETPAAPAAPEETKPEEKPAVEPAKEEPKSN
jgi:hypothetical protein